MNIERFKYNNRDNFIDIGKFFAIVIIVLIHVFQRTIPTFTNSDGWVARVLLILGVTPFFFLSGMSYRYKKELSPLGFIYDIFKRSFSYMIPFIWFILFRVWIYSQWPTISKAWEELMLYPVSGLWVCWILLWITLVVDIGLLISYFKPKLKVLFVSLTIVIGITTLVILRKTNVILYDHSIGYDYFIIYTPSFLLGYLIGPYIKYIKKNYIYIICMIVGLGGLIPLCIYNPSFITTTFLKDSMWPFLIASLCSIIFYIGFIPMIQKIKFNNIFAFIGQYTLEIYFLHLMLLKNWSKMDINNVWLTILISLGLFLLCFINCFLVVAISIFIPFSHFILFGRHLSIYDFEDQIFIKLKNIFIKDKSININVERKVAG